MEQYSLTAVASVSRTAEILQQWFEEHDKEFTCVHLASKHNVRQVVLILCLIGVYGIRVYIYIFLSLWQLFFFSTSFLESRLAF